MKKPSKEYLDTLNREVEKVMSGKVAAARVVEVTINPDGTRTRREINPETDREELARKARATSTKPRNWEAKTDVAKLRQRLDLSQAAFAAALGISRRTLEAWEADRTHPSGPAAALLRIIEKHPEVLLEPA